MSLGQSIRAGKAYVELGVLDQTKKGLQLAERNLTKFGVQVNKFSRRFMKAGTMIGLPLLAAAKVFATFEKQMAEVSTMLDKPEQHMRKFSSTVQSLSIKFGQSTEVLAKGLYQILSATVQASKALGVLEVSGKAAIAGLSDTATAADLITTILNSYGLEASQASRVSDILFATIKRGKTTFAELAQFMGKLTAVSAEVGVKFEEVTAVIALLTRNGIQTEVAVTAIRQALASLLKPAKQSADEFERIFGMAMSPEAIQQMGGLPGFLSKLSERSGKEIAKMFPNVRALMGVLPAASNNKELSQDITAMQNSAGATEEAYKKMANTVQFQLDRIKQAFIALLTNIGEAMMPELREFTETFAGTTKWLAEFIKKNKGLVMAVAKTAVGLLAAGLAIKLFAAAWGVVTVAITGTIFAVKGLMAVMAVLTNLPLGIMAMLTFSTAKTLFWVESLATGLNQSKGKWDSYSDNVGKAWNRVVKNSKMAIGAIVTALKAGNLDLAFEIAIEGMKYLWDEFAFFITDTLFTAFDGVIHRFHQLVNALAINFAKVENWWMKMFPEKVAPPPFDQDSWQWKKHRAHMLNEDLLNDPANRDQKILIEQMKRQAAKDAALEPKGGFFPIKRRTADEIFDDMLWAHYLKGRSEGQIGDLIRKQQKEMLENLGLESLRMDNQDQWVAEEQAKMRAKHDKDMQNRERKLLLLQLQAELEYSKYLDDQAKAGEGDEPDEKPPAPEFEPPKLDAEFSSQGGILRGLTGAFNAAAAARVAMSAMLPPVVAVDERNATANERSAEFLQRIDRKLAGVGLAE